MSENNAVINYNNTVISYENAVISYGNLVISYGKKTVTVFENEIPFASSAESWNPERKLYRKNKNREIINLELILSMNLQNLKVSVEFTAF